MGVVRALDAGTLTPRAVWRMIRGADLSVITYPWEKALQKAAGEDAD